MKIFLYLLIFFMPVLVYSQPEGKLFVHTGFISNHELGYIQYPQNQYHTIDTTYLDDMLTINNKLYISNDKVFIYDIISLTKVDSFNINSTYLIGYDTDNLIVTRTEPPYFEVYNLNTKSLIFSLDTQKVKSQPVDLLVNMGKAYLMYDTTIQIVDLNLKDTIATVKTKYNSWFPSYNQNLINKGNKIYINVAIATGAPRFAILSLNKTTLEVENVLFKEFIDAPYDAILVDNKLYMSTFPSHYDIVADTFIFNQDNLWTYPIGYDSISNGIFLYKPLSFNVNYYHNSNFSSDVTLPTYLNKLVYYNEKPMYVSHKELVTDNIKIYPNPANNELNIMLPVERWVKGIRIVSLNGDNFINIINYSLIHRKIDISYLTDGMYFIEIQFEKEVFKSKFVKTTVSH